MYKLEFKFLTSGYAKLHFYTSYLFLALNVTSPLSYPFKFSKAQPFSKFEVRAWHL